MSIVNKTGATPLTVATPFIPTVAVTPTVEDIFFNLSSTSMSSGNNTTCMYSTHNWLTAKLVLISIMGSFVACFGIFGNLTTALILTRPSMRSPNNLYLTALAVFDTCLLITAILIYSVEYVIEYTDNFELYVAWLTYLRFCYAISHISQTGSVYTTVAVTIERYIAMVHPRRSKVLCTKRGASVSVLGVTCFAIIFNCTKFFELEIKRVSGCKRFSAYKLAEGPLMKAPNYQMVYTLWLSNVVMVFFPFFTLLVLNSVIAWTIRKSYRKLDWANRGLGTKRLELKEKSRDATRVLVIIVLIFLLCNFWGFVTTLLERIYGVRFLIGHVPRFYAFSREAINFLAIINSSINFIIYCIFGKDFRKELIIVYGCRSGFTLVLPVEDMFAPWRSFRLRGRKSFQSIRNRTIQSRAASVPNAMAKIPITNSTSLASHGRLRHCVAIEDPLCSLKEEPQSPEQDSIVQNHNQPSSHQTSARARNKRSGSKRNPRIWKPYSSFQSEGTDAKAENKGLLRRHKKRRANARTAPDDHSVVEGEEIDYSEVGIPVDSARHHIQRPRFAANGEIPQKGRNHHVHSSPKLLSISANRLPTLYSNEIITEDSNGIPSDTHRSVGTENPNVVGLIQVNSDSVSSDPTAFNGHIFSEGSLTNLPSPGSSSAPLTRAPLSSQATNNESPMPLRYVSTGDSPSSGHTMTPITAARFSARFRSIDATTTDEDDDVNADAKSTRSSDSNVVIWL